MRGKHKSQVGLRLEAARQRNGGTEEEISIRHLLRGWLRLWSWLVDVGKLSGYLVPVCDSQALVAFVGFRRLGLLVVDAGKL